ncbi:MAG: gliding motility-associated C-terminal domain-containing protein [Bacteroidia bacterium]
MKRTPGILVFIFFLLSRHVVFAQCASAINAFPYSEGFEAGTGNWTTGGTNNDWAWGSPSKPLINGAGAGSKCWIVGGLTGSFYNFGEKSWCMSPCFDFTNLDKPFVSFLVYWETEFNYDGASLQYSTDGGSTWKTVGNINDPVQCNNQNWYNIAGITNLSGLTTNRAGWSGTTQATSGSCQGGHGIGQWVRATHCVAQLAHQPQVNFRFIFGSGTTCNDYDGFAFDDFTISTPPDLPADFSVTCTSNNSFNFASLSSQCNDYQHWDFGDLTTLSDTSVQATTSYVYSQSGNYTVTMTTGGSCSGDTSVTKTISVYSVNVSSTDITCKDGNDGTATITLSNAPAGTTVSWSTTPSQNSLTAVNLTPGNYTATISDPSGCNSQKSVMLSYGPDAFPSLDLGNDTVICPGGIVQLNARGFTNYLWQDGSTDSSFIVTETGKIVLMVRNSAGCDTADSLLVTEDCLHDILFPNAFTPNDDGINEIFKGVGTIPAKYDLKIYNRWGELIFETENFDLGWNGIYKNHHAEPGLYIYLAQFSFGNEDLIEKAGSVYLFR